MGGTTGPGRRDFATTHWSLVRAAGAGTGGAEETRARRALEELCQLYWYPLYAFVRSRGHGPHDAQDLTQGFFAKLLDGGGFAAADRDRGRFRSYLLGAMKHHLAHERERGAALKRGGAVTFLEWDALDPEARYRLEPAGSSDPEIRFDREWAVGVADRALEQIRSEFAATGKAPLFDALKGCLTGEEPAREETAERLGMSEGAVKVAVHRLRRRYRELVRAAVADTVAEPSEVDDEMRHLVAVLRGR